MIALGILAVGVIAFVAIVILCIWLNSDSSTTPGRISKFKRPKVRKFKSGSSFNDGDIEFGDNIEIGDNDLIDENNEEADTGDCCGDGGDNDGGACDYGGGDDGGGCDYGGGDDGGGDCGGCDCGGGDE